MYGGRSAGERERERRGKLVAAALEIWGDDGWAAVTMRGVCARAALIDRYFYESFADRDALLVAVWDQIIDETIGLLTSAIAGVADPTARLRAAISVIVHGAAADPRRARIAFGEHAGSAALEARRRATLQRFTDLLVLVARPDLAREVDENALRMTTLLGIGGFVELISAWHSGLVHTSADALIDHTTRLGTLLATEYLRR